MLWDNASWRWAIACRNREFYFNLHYAIIKLKLNLFHIMTSGTKVLLFLLAILLQCISKENNTSYFLRFFVSIMSPVVSELTVCLCFEFRHFTKPIPTLHTIIDFFNVLSIGYFIHLLVLLPQHGDIESNLGPKNKQVNNLSCCQWNVNSLLAQNWSIQLTL